jgi:hypothetical protein
MAARNDLTQYIALFLVGGLCTGAGVVNLYYCFGSDADSATDFAHQGMNTNLAQVGFSAMDNLRALPAAEFSLPLIIVGVACLVLANANAWKETDGY